MKYDSQIRDQSKLDFIEEVKNPKTYSSICHFIPHFPVFKTDPNATTTCKIRIVYEASTKTSHNALSLNDCLETGPNLLQQIPAMILAFRTHPIAFSANIEKAFLQIKLDKADRDATWFLWLKDPQCRASEDNLTMWRRQTIPNQKSQELQHTHQYILGNLAQRVLDQFTRVQPSQTIVTQKAFSCGGCCISSR